jgi:putative tricarboxylic transport membrane protein
MVLIGLALTTVGIDPISGVERFTFGIYELSQGIDLVPVAMGLFGIAEVLSAAGEGEENLVPVNVKLRELLPTRTEWRRSTGPILRGSTLGFLIGLIPGPSHVIATFVSYFTEKKLSKHPEEFGHGAIEGVAGPESANNAAVGGAYVPLLALGLPFTPALAVVLGALLLHGITPGPNLINEKPELFWTLIASMYIGNIMLLILNLPLVNLFISILKVPRKLLLPLIAVICLIGVYSIGSSYLDLVILAVLGIAGYAIRGTGYEPAPLVLALVLGPMIETALRQSLKLTRGDIGPIIFRPICIVIYSILILSFLVPAVINLFMQRRKGTTGQYSHQE